MCFVKMYVLLFRLHQLWVFAISLLPITPITLVPWQEAADWRIVVWALIDEMIIAVRIRSFGSIYRFARSLVVQICFFFLLPKKQEEKCNF